MAQFTATVTETVRLFGAAPSDKWGERNWGDFRWGEGTNQLPVGVFVGTSESQASTAAVGVAPVINILESQASNADLEHAYVRDSAGYFYVFPDRTTDEIAATAPSWTARVSSTASWASSAATATSWS